MRTTLNIDDHILMAVKSVAAQRGQSLGQVISRLLEKALGPDKSMRIRNGVPIFPKSGEGPVTMELVNQLRDGELE